MKPPHEEEETLHLEYNQHKGILPPLTFHDTLAKLMKNKKEIELKYIFIDHLELV